MASALLSKLLPPGVDGDTLEYMAGTAESIFEENNEATADDLAEALSELLISYELAADEEAALSICRELHVQMSATASGAAPAAVDLSEPVALLSKPLTMGDDDGRVRVLVSICTRPLAYAPPATD